MTEPKHGRRMDGKLHHVSTSLVLGWMAALLLGGLSLPWAGASVLPSRINGPIQSAETQVMKGTMVVVSSASFQCTLNISRNAPMKVMIAINKSSGP